MFIYQVFNEYLQRFQQHNQIAKLQINVGTRKWLIPLVNTTLEASSFIQFINNLQLEALDYLFVSLSSTMELTIIVFDCMAVEKIYDWY